MEIQIQIQIQYPKICENRDVKTNYMITIKISIISLLLQLKTNKTLLTSIKITKDGLPNRIHFKLAYVAHKKKNSISTKRNTKVNPRSLLLISSKGTIG